MKTYIYYYSYKPGGEKKTGISRIILIDGQEITREYISSIPDDALTIFENVEEANLQLTNQ